MEELLGPLLWVSMRQRQKKERKKGALGQSTGSKEVEDWGEIRLCPKHRGTQIRCRWGHGMYILQSYHHEVTWGHPKGHGVLCSLQCPPSRGRLAVSGPTGWPGSSFQLKVPIAPCIPGGIWGLGVAHDGAECGHRACLLLLTKHLHPQVPTGPKHPNL